MTKSDTLYKQLTSIGRPGGPSVSANNELPCPITLSVRQMYIYQSSTEHMLLHFILHGISNCMVLHSLQATYVHQWDALGPIYLGNQWITLSNRSSRGTNVHLPEFKQTHALSIITCLRMFLSKINVTKSVDKTLIIIYTT